MKRVVIALFRNDLRVHDQPMLSEAISSLANAKDGTLLPVYCFDPRQIDLTVLNDKIKDAAFQKAVTYHFSVPRCNPRRAKFLIETVQALQTKLRSLRSDLLIRFGEPERVVPQLVRYLQEQQHDVSVYMQREYTWEEQRTERRLDKICRLTLTDGGLTLVHPSDTPFKHCPRVFTHFRTKVEGLHDKMVRDALPVPKLPPFPEEANKFMNDHSTDHLRLLTNLDQPFDKGSMLPYKGGEDAALDRLRHYCDGQGKHSPLFTYKQTRNALAGIDDSTHFSAFLANGCLSARQIFKEVTAAENKHGASKDTYWVVFELLWRDFFKFLFDDNGNTLFHLYGFKGEADKPSKQQQHSKHGHQDRGAQMSRAQNQTDDLPNWNTNQRYYDAWTQGKTGIPFIDANMRELAATGYQSNRGRQNTADFLAGQLEVDWRWGAEWFESTLIDHDVCSNTGNWQYTAATGGIDPRNRSFNIIKQAKDYDSDGSYVKSWLPELQDVPAEFVHHPWTIQDRSKYPGLKDYPAKPIIHRPEWKRHMHARPVNQSKQGRANPSERVNKHH